MSLAQRVASAPPSRAPIRRLPTPISEPPFDDELFEAHDLRGERGLYDMRGITGNHGPAAVQQMLALPLAVPEPLPAEPEVALPPAGLTGTAPAAAAPPAPPGPATFPLHLVPAPPESHHEPEPLPPPHAWAARLSQALAEVLSGTRPAQQLVRWTSLDVYACLRRHVAHRLQNTVPGRTRPAPVVLRSVRLSEPLEGIAEVSAVLQIGPRARALALRLEGVDGRWRCTAFEMG